VSPEATSSGPAAAEEAGPPGPLREGLARYRARDFAGAHAAFRMAYRLAPKDPRAMSWYGVTLVVVERNLSLGAFYCDEALRIARPQPDLLLNQARAQLAMGRRERAARALALGLELAPEDPGLLAARVAMGRRRHPVIPFLSRDNPLNIWLGKLRHRWSGRARQPQPLSPATLGMPLDGAAPEA
jgi:tetratricopeptide (TPR) repeat protein